jgi:hemolysin activation/secretion protein
MVLIVVAGAASAQVVPQDVRPSDRPLDRPPIVPEDAEAPAILAPFEGVPDFEPEPARPGGVLPPLELPEVEPPETDAAEPRARIDRIEVRGNTVLAPEDVAAVVSRYEGRVLAFSELQALRDALTDLYIDAGYETSGAVIPPQSVLDGALEVEMAEGMLERIEIQNEGRLRDAYLRSRLETERGEVVNVWRLEERLQVLQRDERIESLHATLMATAERGGAVLRVRVVEARAWWVAAGGGNLSSPLIGEWRADLAAGHRNVLGFGDLVEAELRLGETLRDVRILLGAPISRFDTTLLAFMRRTRSRVIEGVLEDFDIESRTETYGLELVQPVRRTRRSDLDAFLSWEWRRSRSSLLGDPFSFVPGPQDGVATLSVLRAGVQYTSSGARDALALRTQLSVGIDALGATSNPGDVPDGQFLSWLAQLEYARRLDVLRSELLTRGAVQLSTRPLLGREQFAIGGYRTVRAFRQNRIVRDNGVIGSVELRVPVPLPSFGTWRPRLAAVPFVDAGYGWNTDRGTPAPSTLASVGVGLLAWPHERLQLAIFWGEPLTSGDVDGDALQDRGVTVEAVWSY